MLSKPYRKVLFGLCIVIIFMCITYTHQINEPMYKTEPEQLEEVKSTTDIRSSYDVVVVGTDPEGITAAISAARNDLKVLLVDNRNRTILGGLMTVGWLNSLDLNKSPTRYPLWKKPIYLNKGIFQEWYNGIMSTSFDVNHAANLFHQMVTAEANIDLLMDVKTMEPIVVDDTVVGMHIVDRQGRDRLINAKAVIDATQDADIAAAAGVEYTLGREDLGDPDAQMAVTLVIKLSGVTQKRWDALKNYKNTGFDDQSIWGYQDAREYVSSQPDRVKIRSLNIGRQDGDTLLINTMQIYGIDPLDPASVQEGLRIGQKEAPLIVDFLKQRYKTFSELSFAGTAPELYVRETRHIKGEYRLSMVDVMDNRDHWDAIAYGAYEVDIQSLSASINGSILMVPEQYGVPFRCLVPLKIDGLLVVGRSASFDTLPHGSARVIPLGMATGQAAGVAVKLALDHGITLRELSQSKQEVTELRSRLTKQGVDLHMRSFSAPKYTKHKDYKGLLAAASIFITVGGYSNEGWNLDSASNTKRFASAVRAIQRMYPSKMTSSLVLMSSADAKLTAPLTLEQAAYMITIASGIPAERTTALQMIKEQGWIREETIEGFDDPNNLTNGDTFMLLRDLLEYEVGVTFE